MTRLHLSSFSAQLRIVFAKLSADFAAKSANADAPVASAASRPPGLFAFAATIEAFAAIGKELGVI